MNQILTLALVAALLLLALLCLVAAAVAAVAQWAAAGGRRQFATAACRCPLPLARLRVAVLTFVA